jgi:serine/threonine protein phosphatase 1
MKTYVVGDIHGEYEKLLECLQAVNFDYNEDTLIQLGDVVDRGLKSYECVEELLKIKNLISIRGNHDLCFYNGFRYSKNNYLLFHQGCKETIESYIKNCCPEKEVIGKMDGISTNFDHQDIPDSHINFFKNQLNYFIDKDNNCFVHGGFNRHYLIDKQPDEAAFWWDRDLLNAARSYASMKNNEYPFKNKNNFKEIFIGHTPVQYYGESTPQKYANIWNLDTGSGKGGILTIMNLETKEFYQSK